MGTLNKSLFLNLVAAKPPMILYLLKGISSIHGRGGGSKTQRILKHVCIAAKTRGGAGVSLSLSLSDYNDKAAEIEFLAQSPLLRNKWNSNFTFLTGVNTYLKHLFKKSFEDFCITQRFSCLLPTLHGPPVSHKLLWTNICLMRFLQYVVHLM